MFIHKSGYFLYYLLGQLAVGLSTNLKESTMRKYFSALVLLIAGLSILLYTGCSSDDGGGDPVDPCSIAVTTPGAGSSFLFGEAADIRWSKTGDATGVNITLLKDGTDVGVIKNGAGNLGFYSWSATTFGAGSGDDYTVRVTAVGETGCGDEGPEFSIIDTEGCNFTSTMADYFLVAPGDTCRLDGTFNCALEAGNQVELTWEGVKTSGKVDIELLISDFIDTELVGMIAFNAEDSGSYMWTIDSFNNAAAANGYFIRVSDHQVPECKVESGRFRMLDDDICAQVVDAPELGNEWAAGSTQTIMWTPDASTTSVELRLYAGSAYVGPIALNVAANPGEYQWTVSRMGHTGTNSLYHIHVLDMADVTCKGISDKFTITSK